MTSQCLLINTDNYTEQDTNPLQAALYRALAAAPPHTICVVGDDDQALYRFRGGTVGCLVHFAEECQQAWPGCSVRQLSLVKNYRSQPTIVAWYNHFISVHPQMSLPYARVADKASLQAQSPTCLLEPAVVAIRGKTLKESAKNFVEIVCLLKEQGAIDSYAQCALLAYRIKGRTAQVYIKELQQQGVPVAGYIVQKEHLAYQHILGTLFLSLDRSKNQLPSNIDPGNAAYIEQCRQAALAEPELARIARQIHTWLLTEARAASSMSLTKLAQRILNARPCISAIEHDQEAEAAVRTLIRALDAYDRIVEKGLPIPLEDVPGLPGKKRVAAWWMGRLYFVLVEGIQQEHLERGDTNLPRPQSAALSLHTIHNAKGLEFPVVAVVVEKHNQISARSEHQLERDVFPFRQDGSKEQAAQSERFLGGNDEERAMQDLIRLHYVAYSRPQTLLLLLIVDEHLEQEPPAIGLGKDVQQFRSRVEVWPVKKARASKKTRKYFR